MPDREWAHRVEAHLGQHHELDRLWNDHVQIEARLAELDKIKWLTNEQEFERRRLQKEKLAGKDRMLELVDELEGAAPVV